MRQLRGRIAAALLVVALAGGCASFRAGKLAPITGWPPPQDAKKSVRLLLDAQFTFNGSAIEGAGAMTDKLATRTGKIYAESGLFSEVRRGAGDTDLVADVRFTRAEEGSLGMAVLTGLTLYLIPSKADLIMTMKTTFRNRDGDVLGVVEKTETNAVWQQMFLFPVMFAKHPISVFWRTFDDLNRATLTDAKALGYL
jgi:hypothetical protein